MSFHKVFKCPVCVKKKKIGNLLKKLKVYCGTGGSLNDQGIQLQGDMQDKVKFFLRKEGYII